MPSDDIAVSVRNLTKTYRLFGHPGDRIKQFFSLGLKRYHREFTALRDVSFEVRKGETVGIIGRNGSGKSTLLQLICGILKPTAGTVQVNGRIAALLELGAGFNPEFTGRENIYFQGALMGFSESQIDERFEAIAEFADIGEFIDEPVRIYSSGMFVRLAFAVATHIDADILVVDEALAVGDMAFQRKCFERLGRLLADKQCIVVLVSHDLRQVERFCTRAILLDEGRMLLNGNSESICREYDRQLSIAERTQGRHGTDAIQAKVEGTGEAEIIDVRLMAEDGSEVAEVSPRGPLRIEVRFRLQVAIERAELFVGTQAAEYFYLSTSSTAELASPITLGKGEHRILCRLAQFPLAPGRYFVRFAIRDGNFRLLLAASNLCPFWVGRGANEYNQPKRFLDLDAEWALDGTPLTVPPRSVS